MVYKCHFTNQFSINNTTTDQKARKHVIKPDTRGQNIPIDGGPPARTQHFLQLCEQELDCLHFPCVSYNTRWGAFHIYSLSGSGSGAHNQNELWQTEEWRLPESGPAGSEPLQPPLSRLNHISGSPHKSQLSAYTPPSLNMVFSMALPHVA